MTLPAHGAVELIAGIALMLLPIMLGFGPAGLVTSLLLGAVLTGAAVALNTSPVGPSAAFHSEFDSMFAAVAGVAAFVLAIGSHGAPALLIAGAAVTVALLRYTTRYVISG